MLGNYANIYAVGSRSIENLFDGPVVIEEKIDGSQIAFGILGGELQVRSKNKQFVLSAPDKMFSKAVTIIEGLDLHPGWTYRGEYLQKPRHSNLKYDRVPANHIIGFDIETEPGIYLSPEFKRDEFLRIGLETVPVFHQGEFRSLDMLAKFLESTSVLGGTKIEGVVVKNYNVIAWGSIAMGKYVAHEFEEVYHTTKVVVNEDILEKVIVKYKTEARWNKAVQHIKEDGELLNDTSDIGKLMAEVSKDILKECTEDIKDMLFKLFWKNIQRGVTTGLADWYKQKLAEGLLED
jgi:hypothetical protein